MKEQKNKSQKLKGLLNLIERYFSLLLILIIVVILSFGIYFFVRPKFRILSGMKQKLERVDPKTASQIALYDKEIKKLKEVVQSYNKLTEKEVEKINKILPEKKESVELFSQIDSLIKRNGLILGLINIKETNTERGRKTGIILPGSNSELEKKDRDLEKKELELDIEIKGASYFALKSLLSSFENNLRIIDVQSVKYDPRDETVDLVLKSYYLEG